jgi:hypothetical protein
MTTGQLVVSLSTVFGGLMFAYAGIEEGFVAGVEYGAAMWLAAATLTLIGTGLQHWDDRR